MGGKMESKAKWVKRLTVVATAVTVVALIMFVSLLLGIIVIAPVINSLPVLIAVGLGSTLSCIGVWQAMRAPRQLGAAFQNLILIVFHAAIVWILFPLWVVTVNETVIVPEGFMGTVVIIYGVPTGGPLERDSSGSLTYRIPVNGLLLIRDPAPEHTISRRQYFAAQVDGSLSPITAHWYTTIHDTEADFHSPTVGTYLEGSIGEFSPGGGTCKFRNLSFVIGTKQYISSGQRVIEPKMLSRANLLCPT